MRGVFLHSTAGSVAEQTNRISDEEDEDECPPPSGPDGVYPRSTVRWLDVQLDVQLESWGGAAVVIDWRGQCFGV